VAVVAVTVSQVGVLDSEPADELAALLVRCSELLAENEGLWEEGAPVDLVVSPDLNRRNDLQTHGFQRDVDASELAQLVWRSTIIELVGSEAVRLASSGGRPSSKRAGMHAHAGTYGRLTRASAPLAGNQGRPGTGQAITTARERGRPSPRKREETRTMAIGALRYFRSRRK